MNYGNYKDYKIKYCCFFFNIIFFFQNLEYILACLVYFVQIIVILNIGFGFCVLDCIWEHGWTICSKKKYRNVSQKCEHISYEIFSNNCIYIYIYIYVCLMILSKTPNSNFDRCRGRNFQFWYWINIDT